MAKEADARGPLLRFRTNVDEWVDCDADHRLRFEAAADGGLTPYLHVRGDLLQADPRVDQVLAKGVAQRVGREVVEPGQEFVSGQQRLDASGSHGPALSLEDRSLLADMLRVAQDCQRGPGVAKSIPYFRQAIARDSTFARAWAQLGTAYGFLAIFDLVAPDTAFRAARVAIDRGRPGRRRSR